MLFRDNASIKIAFFFLKKTKQNIESILYCFKSLKWFF